jgi:hypothetical protein
MKRRSNGSRRSTAYLEDMLHQQLANTGSLGLSTVPISDDEPKYRANDIILTSTLQILLQKHLSFPSKVTEYIQPLDQQQLNSRSYLNEASFKNSTSTDIITECQNLNFFSLRALIKDLCMQSLHANL